MADILDTLKTYPDDPTVVMSRRVVNETISEIERLRAELAALRENSLAVLTRVRGYRDKVIAERDALRAQLDEAREAHKETLRLHYCDEDAAILKAEREFRDFGYTPGGRKLNIGERIKHAESRAELKGNK